MSKVSVNILENNFLKDNGEFDLERALLFCGKIAGICYDEIGFEHVLDESEESTLKRTNMTLSNGHHSVYDHVKINFHIQNLPKMLAMVLNNERDYSTSERSLRYTAVSESSGITREEMELYNKWLEIFKIKIKDRYSDVHSDGKIKKLAQENARYLVTVFISTSMIYTASIREINYIASWMQDYIKNAKTPFEKKLSISMKEFVNELARLNVLDSRLMKNEKHRKLSLFGTDLDSKEEYFSEGYGIRYKGTPAQLAQAHRFRPATYEMEFLPEFECFVPPIIEDDEVLVKEWLHDMNSVKELVPQGQLVNIYESGTFDKFILKCKERLCAAAQLEVMMQTRETLMRMKEEYEKNGHPNAKKIEEFYSAEARCTFPDYECLKPCGFGEAINLTRKI